MITILLNGRSGIRWFKPLKEYTENVFMYMLGDGSLNITFILETLDGQIKKETLQGKKLCLEDDVKEGYLNIEGTAIDSFYGR